MVDYSKFDRIVADASDDEDEARTRATPNVTRLEAGMKITFGNGRATIAARADADDDEVGDRRARDADARDADEGEEGTMSERELRAALEARDAAAARDAARATTRARGDDVAGGRGADRETRLREMTRNGGVVLDAETKEERYYWRQDASEATVSVVVAPRTKAKDARVRVTATEVEISVLNRETGALEVVLRGEWAHEIDPEPRDEDDEYAPTTFGDWEITDFEGADARRVVRVTVRKKGSQMLTHWWRSCIKGAPEEDPSTFEDRNSSRAEAGRRAWDEAQEMFRERVKTREKVEVDAHD